MVFVLVLPAEDCGGNPEWKREKEKGAMQAAGAGTIS